MPRRFLTAQDRERLSHFPAAIEESDLIAYFLLTPADLEQVMRIRTDTQRLGFALLLCGLRYLGYFPSEVQTAPASAIAYVAQQIGCDPQALADYGRRAQTRRAHQLWLMDYLGFRRMEQADLDALLEWLSQRALENDRPSILLQQASEHLYLQRLARPGITTIERLVVTARQRAVELTYQALEDALDDSLRSALDQLLQPRLPQGTTPWSWLSRPARGYNADDILDALGSVDISS
jgi:TnpA family transposase